MIYEELLKRESHVTPIRVGSSGAGWMGSGFAAQMSQVPGMDLVLIADVDVGAARQAFLATGLSKDDLVETASATTAEDAIRNGKRVITGDYSLGAKVDSIDIVTDVTPSPLTGAQTALAAIENGKDVVLINIEADVTVGRILKSLAKQAGVLYSVSSGDEPGCLMELYDFVKCLGFEVIVIGKGKNNPLNRKATPETVAESASRAGKDPFQTASYVDGSKTMFEMTCAANATGCLPMKRGMIGPEADLGNISKIFALKEDGGLTLFPGAVDFVQGKAMAGGVFVTVRVDNPRIRDDLQYLKVGEGHYFTFFRPYHLWFIEAPISLARAYLNRQTTLVPQDYSVAETMAVAKRDLEPGEKLDTFGGYTFYGLMDRAVAAKQINALPTGLAPGAIVARPIKADRVISWTDVELDEESVLVQLRRKQDSMEVTS